MDIKVKTIAQMKKTELKDEIEKLFGKKKHEDEIKPFEMPDDAPIFLYTQLETKNNFRELGLSKEWKKTFDNVTSQNEEVKIAELSRLEMNFQNRSNNGQDAGVEGFMLSMLKDNPYLDPNKEYSTDKELINDKIKGYFKEVSRGFNIGYNLDQNEDMDMNRFATGFLNNNFSMAINSHETGGYDIFNNFKYKYQTLVEEANGLDINVIANKDDENPRNDITDRFLTAIALEKILGDDVCNEITKNSLNGKTFPLVKNRSLSFCMASEMLKNMGFDRMPNIDKVETIFNPLEETNNFLGAAVMSSERLLNTILGETPTTNKVIIDDANAEFTQNIKFTFSHAKKVLGDRIRAVQQDRNRHKLDFYLPSKNDINERIFIGTFLKKDEEVRERLATIEKLDKSSLEYDMQCYLNRTRDDDIKTMKYTHQKNDMDNIKDMMKKYDEELENKKNGIKKQKPETPKASPDQPKFNH